MNEQQQILAMILSAKAAGKNEDEIVEMLREARNARYEQDNSILEHAPTSTISEQYEEQYEEIAEQYEEIEWIFPDEEVEAQTEHLIETSPVSIISNPNDWEIGVDDQLTVETSLDPVIDSPSGLAIVKTSQLGEHVLRPQIARKRNNQSPLSILSAFVFLGAVIGVTVYQFFRLHPKPYNLSQEATFEPPIVIMSDAPTVNPGKNPLPPPVNPSNTSLSPPVSPSDNSLPPGCGAYSGTREAHIKELKASGATLRESFPAECQAQLDELQFKYAIEKLAANDGDFQAATTMICEVTDTYFKTDQDPFRRPFFRDWSENNNNFKAWLETHLAAGDCPAANYLQ
ncbi:MAG: hypothetical protein MJA27_34420 [Pseudanabaenales cyanobacterium]|nr:hypothetical protein [Pseudanabaenales cyanobacterium]